MIGLNLKGALVPVTGAASGIALAIAQQLRVAGATPILLDVNEPALDGAVASVYGESADAASFGYVVDVSNSSAIEDCFSAIRRDHGVITHAVASAGMSFHASITEMTDAEWSRVLGLNLSGVMYFCRAAARALAEQESGAIVTFSSVAGIQSKENRAAYSATKSAVIGLTRALALDLGPGGIRVNSVAPGVTETPMQLINPAEHRQRISDRTALGRCGNPDEIANAALFLLSDLASYITGQTLVVDGGLTIRYD